MKHPLIIGILLLFVVLQTIPSGVAQFSSERDDIFTTQFMEIDLQIKTTAATENDARITEFKTEFSYFPQESYRQEVVALDASPRGNIVGNAYVFKLKNPDPSELTFALNARIKTENKFYEINNTIPYPIEKYTPDILQYTRATPTIDSGNEDIAKLALAIAENETDLYVVVNKVGIWVEENIEYSLDSITQTSALPASWALKNQRGICDELTNLFIAMLRSLGIPARFVSGIAYTNDEHFADTWNPHGWAEVYFPEVGWVPFDITYGQFSYIDATHIKLSDSLDPDYLKTKFTWTGNQVDVFTTPLSFDAKIAKQYGKKIPKASMNLSIEEKEMGIGGYNLIKATIRNEESHYTTLRLMLGNVEIITPLERNHQQVILAPWEEKTVYWTIQSKEDLDPTLIYTVPILVYTSFGVESKDELVIDALAVAPSLEEIKEKKEGTFEEKKKRDTNGLQTICTPKKETFFEDEPVEILCNIKNQGTQYLENIQVCFQQCQRFDLEKGQEKSILHHATNLTLGGNQVKVAISTGDIEEIKNIGIILKDRPHINIKNVKTSPHISFSEPFTINITLEKASNSIPQRIILEIKSEYFSKVQRINQLTRNQTLQFEIEAGRLRKGNNSIEIILRYSDDKEQAYHMVTREQVVLKNVTLFEKMAIAVRDRVHRIQKWFL